MALSFANSFSRKLPYDYFAEDDTDSMVEEICINLAAVKNRLNFEKFATFYAFFEHDFTDAYQSHPFLTLKDNHIDIGQKH